MGQGHPRGEHQGGLITVALAGAADQAARRRFANRLANIERPNLDGRTIPPAAFCRACSKPSQRAAIFSQNSRSFLSVHCEAELLHWPICCSKKSSVPSIEDHQIKDPA
jgi:hypothetical protein